ncbi:hypothetical protein CCMA1212_003334 [Trichoderma ghanense]|uniref:Uncharacterized protein n=1 Tax=Trichoderma ghanense TaxID=65468 RepID=A0ABY2H8M3_9HYPO
MITHPPHYARAGSRSLSRERPSQPCFPNPNHGWTSWVVQILAALWFARNKLAGHSLCVAVLVLVFVLMPVPALEGWGTGETRHTDARRDYRPEELRQPLPMLCMSEHYQERPWVQWLSRVPASPYRLLIIKSFRCRYQWMPRDAHSEPDRGPLLLRGSWGFARRRLFSGHAARSRPKRNP